MQRESSGSLLSTVFVDYDNIYLSLKRKNEEAAKRFAKNAGLWIRAIASGELITPTNGVPLSTPRRIVMNRCYGNPVPRRNNKDNATDMSSFPFVRHHYLRAGFEVIDCPPLTAQLKNSADIRMVMDVRDYLLHDTYFDEFIILSGDADFTPVLHRLRAHARRTVIYANDYTAAPYKAISDGEIRERDLIALLMGDAQSQNPNINAAPSPSLPSPQMLTQTRTAIIDEVLDAVNASQKPLPLEALADRAVRVLGHDKTVGTAWGGMGSFRDLLAGGLPKTVTMSQEAPYYVFDKLRQQRSLPAVAQPQIAQPAPSSSLPELDTPVPAPKTESAIAPAPAGITASATPAAQTRAPAPAPMREAEVRQPDARAQTFLDDAAFSQPIAAEPIARAAEPAPRPVAPANHSAPSQTRQVEPAAPQSAAPAAAPEPAPDRDTAIQQSIARIHEACQAPPLSPPEYRVMFEVMAGEIKTNGLTGARTLANIVQAAQELGVSLRRDDARFILEVVSEADPWFEQGASAQLFASRFRNFVVARCRGQGMNLSANDLDLIDAWFSGVAYGNQTGPGPRGTPHQPTESTRPTPNARPVASGHDAASAHQSAPSASLQQQQQQQQQQPAEPMVTQPANPVGHAAGPASSRATFGDVVPANTPSVTADPFDGGNSGHRVDDDEFPLIIRSRARG